MSALTSLLVRDDAVSVRQIEDALQRQVMDGGDLDTALLEQGALPENVLIAYRAVSEGARPASRAEVMNASTATRAVITPALAIALRVTPLAHDETKLVVASHRQLSAAEQTKLSEHTRRRIELRITSELRVYAALQRFYGHPLPTRFSALLRRVDAAPAGELVHIEALRDAPPPSNGQELMPGFDETDDFESALETAFDRVSGAPPGQRASAEPANGDATRPVNGKPVRASHNHARARGGVNTEEGEATASLRTSGAGARPAPATATRARPTLLQLPQGPLSPAIVEKALASAEERDDVMEIFFRFSRQYFDSTLLLSIKGERLRGVQAHNMATVVDVRDVSVPILRGGAVDDLTRTLLPRVVDLSRKDEDRVLALAMKRVSAQPAALIPVCIKRRVVSVLYGDRSGQRVQLDELGELLALGAHVTRAFERIIHTRKALGLSSNRAPDRERDLQHAPTQRSIQLPLAPAHSVASALAEAALLAARSDEALASLGVGRPPPTPPAPRDYPRVKAADPRGESEPLTSAPAEPAVSTRYFSKPPPGTGRYRSLPSRNDAAKPGPTDEAAERARVDHTRARREQASADAVGGDETQPLRSSRRPGQHGSSAPAPAGRAANDVRASVPVGKPGPGAYASHTAATERVSVPGASAQQVAQAQRAASEAEVARQVHLRQPQAEPLTAAPGQSARPAPMPRSKSRGTELDPPAPVHRAQPETWRADPRFQVTPSRTLTQKPPAYGMQPQAGQAAAPEAPARAQKARAAQPGQELSYGAAATADQSSADIVRTQDYEVMRPPATRATQPQPHRIAEAAEQPSASAGLSAGGQGVTPVVRAPVANASAAQSVAAAAGPAARAAAVTAPVSPASSSRAAGGTPSPVAAGPSTPGAKALADLPGETAATAAPAVAAVASSAQPAAAAAGPAAKGNTAASEGARAERLVEQLCRHKPEEEMAEVTALQVLGEPALSLLLARFPGPLWFDRRRAHAKLPLARDISPIARALHAFGDLALERMTIALRSKDAETRYYATLFSCDRVHKALLDPLLERLFDEDPQIRLLVRDVLPRYRRLSGFTQVVERLGAQALDDTAPLRTRLAAIDAISVLRDANCVPALIPLIDHADRQISVPAHRALTLITCQDFGKAVKKWRAWFESNEYRHRVEWLIEGLMHADQALRASAGLELQKLTQVYYGYVAAASKRDRELAQKRYWDWWRSEGRQKF